jgi:hypothetical protein
MEIHVKCRGNLMRGEVFVYCQTLAMQSMRVFTKNTQVKTWANRKLQKIGRGAVTYAEGRFTKFRI